MACAGWSTRGENSSVLYNQYNGRQLADSLCAALNTEVLNHGMDNKGKPCTPSVRRKAAAKAYAEAARAGNKWAQYNYALCLYSGSGVERNLEEAAKFW